MFMLRNVSKYLFGDTSKESIVEIPQGQLYLVRPLSPKGYSELIFRDAAASIRRTGQPYQYQLVIQRVYEEGEQELLDEDDDGAGGDGSHGLCLDKDEKTFLLDESLQFRVDTREGGENVFAWKDLSGDPGDLYEFVCDTATPANSVSSFELVAVECQFERKYKKSHTEATEEDLKQFEFSGQPIPDPADSSKAASPSASLILPSRGAATGSGAVIIADSDKMAAKTPVKKAGETTVAPPSAKAPETREVLAAATAELHLYDFESGTFILQDAEVRATVTEVGNWNYWLQIAGDKRDWLGQAVVEDINPVFNFEFLSFIFNHYVDDVTAYSWLLRFKDQTRLEHFQQGLMQALWEHLNQIKWAKVQDLDREYVMDAFQDLVMEDAPAEEEEDEDEDEAEPVAEQSEDYDSDESQGDTKEDAKSKGTKNSGLAVGFKNDRSYVIRGSNIGVFKHDADNSLSFSTNIRGVKTPGGKEFTPVKTMLHAEDRNLILQDADNANALYRMDLETGKVVDEWKMHDDIPVTSFAPEKKYAQMTGEQTFIGLSRNALYRVDPRLAGNKLVESQLKQYAFKNDFTTAATTDKGYIAVVSNKGEIRMFDRLGINAKTLVPALGDPIIGVDVAADGRWILCTTRTYLLLLDALQKDGKNKGALGFEKSFPKDAKPQPRRLGLAPAHVAQIAHETKAPLSFTPAHFNTGVGSDETTIVTSTGPFIVTWSLKKVLAGRKDPYSIKRYAETIAADAFRYGSDKNMIVTLPDEVSMVARRALRKPTRESIASTPVPRTPRRKGYLGRNEVVDSPY